MFFPFFINSDLEENPLEQIEARAFNGLKHLQKLWVSANKRQTEVYIIQRKKFRRKTKIKVNSTVY